MRAGEDKGRIYRVVAPGKAKRTIEHLDSLATIDLANQLETRNGTVRDNVQRILVQRADPIAVGELERLARRSQIAEARAQAICTLDGLSSLEPVLIVEKLADPHPGVRRQAARLSESFLDSNGSVGPALSKLVDDPDELVRFDAAVSLGSWRNPAAAEALGKLMLTSGSDARIRSVILSSASNHSEKLLEIVLESKQEDFIREWFDPLIATMLGNGDAKAAAQLFDTLLGWSSKSAGAAVKFGATAKALDALRKRPNAHGLDAISDDPRLRGLVEDAKTFALDSKAPIDARGQAVGLLGKFIAEDRSRVEVLVGLLSPSNPSELQDKAIDALFDQNAPDEIFSRWDLLESGRRVKALSCALSRRDWSEKLWSRIEAKTLLPSGLDASSRARLLEMLGPEARVKASKIFAVGSGTPERLAVIADYRKAMQGIAGERVRGEKVFAKVCASCHKIKETGYDVGPDLAALTDRSQEAFLTAILDPNKELDARYANYTLAFLDGRVATGLLAGESGSTIILKGQGGKTESILRSEIEAIRGGSKSLMPEGIEKDVDPLQMADLIAYLASNGSAPTPKVFSGNHPQTALANDKGAFRLSAKSAEIRGDSLVYEAEFENLGYWHSANDRASWRVQVDRGGVYTVSINWACAEESSGNAYLIEVGGKTIRGKVGGTANGVWSEYRTMFVGEVKLEPGEHQLRIAPEVPPRGALMDLRSVTLEPRLNLRK